VLRVLLVNNIEAAFAPNDLVVGTPLLYTSPYFHEWVSYQLFKQSTLVRTLPKQVPIYSDTRYALW